MLPALAQLAERTSCAILLVRPIAAGQAAVAQKPGSLELLAAVASSLLILSDPEDHQQQRLLLATKHALCEQPPILGFQLTTAEQGILALDWLGTYTHPLPPYQKSKVPLSSKNLSLLRQAIRDTLHDCAAPMNARSLAAISGFSYDHVRKTLQRMLHAGQLVSPARGLYTTPAHPCLGRPAAPISTPPPEPPVPGVAFVPGDPGTPPLPASEHEPANDSPEPPIPNPAVESLYNTLSSALVKERKQGGDMEYRNLGRTGWKISAIGLGAWGIGGDWGPTDDKTSLAALHRAIDLGVNFIDTADVYGDGHSEQLIAQVRKARSEQLIIATKAGRRLNPHTAQGYTRQNLTAFVERSLRNLEMEALDLLQLHTPPSEVYDMPEVFGILDDLAQQGKIRYYGVSVERVDEALKAVSYPNVQSVQIIFNMFRLKPSEHFFSVAREHQVGILARVPLASGLLTGKFRPDTHFAPNDHRSFNRHGEAFDQGETFSGLEYEAGLQAVEELRPLVPQGSTMAQFALRWILMFPEVTSAIPGGKNPQQVEENVNAAALPPLSPDTMIEVLAINDAYIWPQVHHRW